MLIVAHTKKKSTLLTTAATFIGYASIQLYNAQFIEAGALFVAALLLMGLYEKFNLEDMKVSSKDLEDDVMELAQHIRDYMDDETDDDGPEAIRDLLDRKQVKTRQQE